MPVQATSSVEGIQEEIELTRAFFSQHVVYRNLLKASFASKACPLDTDSEILFASVSSGLSLSVALTKGHFWLILAFCVFLFWTFHMFRSPLLESP